MAYQTGTLSGNAAILTTLATFAAANGWTIDTNVAGWLHIHNAAGQHVDFRNNDYYVWLRPATGYLAAGSGGNSTNQPGSPEASWFEVAMATHISFAISGTMTYWLMGNLNQIAMVLKLPGGNRYAHMVFGTGTKHGTYTGGEFVTASRYDAAGTGFEYGNASIFDGYQNTNGGPNTVIRCSLGGGVYRASLNIEQDPNWDQDTSPDPQPVTHYGPMTGRFWLEHNPQMIGNSAIEIKAAMMRLRALIVDPDTELIRPYLTLPKVRAVDMTDISPEAEITVGGNTWKVFPASRKATLATDYNASENYGIAYLKEV